jgi:hypothetical protein
MTAITASPLPRTGLTSALRDRYLDILASVYLYNEHRGYTSLDRVIAAVRRCCPDEPEFLAEVVRHRADEAKHYHMFRRWFERQGHMPLAMDRRVGHIDRFILRTFGCTIDELDTDRIAATPAEFEQLCRVIMLTEQRGYRQVEVLLGNGWVRSDPVMRRIFEIVHRDEPGHFLPYQRWLERRGRATARWHEKWTDFWIHRALLFARIPALFLDPALPRLERWPHQDDPAPV